MKLVVGFYEGTWQVREVSLLNSERLRKMFVEETPSRWDCPLEIGLFSLSVERPRKDTLWVKLMHKCFCWMQFKRKLLLAFCLVKCPLKRYDKYFQNPRFSHRAFPNVSLLDSCHIDSECRKRFFRTFRNFLVPGLHVRKTHISRVIKEFCKIGVI